MNLEKRSESMYQRILIPLDGSEEAEAAVDEAARLSPNPEIVHLQLVESGVMQSRQLEGYAMYADQIDDARKRSGEAYLRPLRRKLEALGLRASISAAAGDPLLQIAEQAKALDADLILLSGEEGGWFRRRAGLARLAPLLAKKVKARLLLIRGPARPPEALDRAA